MLLFWALAREGETAGTMDMEPTITTISVIDRAELYSALRG